MLYLEHFGLNEPPFRITPHTDFFFDGGDRGATLDALLYAILHDEGIVKVSGEVGSGKTMLCRVLMERLPENVEIVFLANPSLARDEILNAISDDLDVEFPQGRITTAMRNLLDCLIGLYADNRRVVILIDEAHAMPEETLEQVRLLSNLESNQHKLLQIVLFGQPELDELLDKASMRQLKDRITHSFRMRPFREDEIGKYLSFRMRAAGYRGPDVFSSKAVTMISKAASGLTRRINILADKSLLAAFTLDSHAVTAREARTAIRDSEFGRLLHEKKRSPALYGTAVLLTGLALGAGMHWILSQEPALTPPDAGGKTSLPIPPSDVRPAIRVPTATPTPPIKTISPAPNSMSVSQPASGDAAGSAGSAPGSRPAASATGASGSEHAKPSAALQQSPLSAAAIAHISAYQTGTNIILKQRVIAALAHLKEDSDSNISIELFGTENSDPARMERFLIRARDLVPLEDIYVFPEPSGKSYRIRVTLGSYADRIAAAEAAEHLPPKYKQAFRPEMRSFAELREAQQI